MIPAGGVDLSTLSAFKAEKRHSVVRLLIIPFSLFIVWILETYLLEGSADLFVHFQPPLFILYTVFANIVVGIFIPVICFRSAFLSGAVNMFQAGFRSLRRTVSACALTAIFGYLYLITFTPAGADRFVPVNAIAFIIPPAVAEVMICWVLIGTHLQAYMRKGSAAISISLGVVVTAVLFGISFAAHSPPLNRPDVIVLLCVIGAGAALFFFAVRDVYATVICVACATVPVVLEGIDPVVIGVFMPSVYGAAALSLASLAGSHLYLSGNFRTIRVPV